MTLPGSGDDSGSLTVELIVLTPLLFMIAIFSIVFGRVATARQQVVESSRAGAEVAAVLPDAGQAASGAVRIAVVGALDSRHICPSPEVETDTSHFFPGGYVTVSVACRVTFSDLSVPGIPGSTVVRASSTAPIDPYRSVR
jgi:Flp pilus assembly protein TadG